MHEPSKNVVWLLQLQYAAKRGFYLVAPKPGAQLKGGAAGPLPRKFVQLEGGSRSRNTVACTTAELNALNARLKDATNDCMIITEQVRCWHTKLGEARWNYHSMTTLALSNKMCS